MVTTPVMLTCLCVVDWHEHELPAGRASLYAAVVRWLSAARRQQRTQIVHAAAARLQHDDVVWRAHARLAFTMMTAPGGRRVVLDFGAATTTLSPMCQRFPDLTHADDAGHAVRAWLSFECLPSSGFRSVPGCSV